MTAPVLIVVTHLLGAGHLTRAAALARAFATAGHPTTLVSGGMPTGVVVSDELSFVQLPPVQIRGTDFASLLDQDSNPVAQGLLEARRDALRDTLRRVRPDVLITELYPFGRRVLTDEFMALLHEAREMQPRPLVLSSIRDILVVPTKPDRLAQTLSRIEEFYDAVLVHGDPALAPLELSWPVDDRLRSFIHYTGYVDENPASLLPQARDGIVVSGGSSAASLPLYRAAVAAAREIRDKCWKILVGRGVSAEDFVALQQSASAHVAVERARSDFRNLLAGAELSISQAGYNTSVDILRSGVRAILVPFEAGRETEQLLRARCLESIGVAQVLPESRLDAASLAHAVAAAFSIPAPGPTSILLDGAARSVATIKELALAHPAVHRPAIDWSPLETALDAARGRGCEIAFWWRDDDAVAHTSALDRLLELAKSVDGHVAIAAIPQLVEPSLVHRLRQEERACILVHGSSHTNHAGTEPKAEFGPHRSLDTMASEIAASLQKLRNVFGPELLPVFVPPWNRIVSDLVPQLEAMGYIGLSTFRDRQAPYPAAGILQINTHVDPIDWHGTRSLGDVSALVSGLAQAVDRRAAGKTQGEPIGLLTHHLAHDQRIWAFCEELVNLLATKRLHFVAAPKLFCDKM